jgi:hypothetical protein
MQSITRTYTLRRFPNSRDLDYAAVLNIYVTSVSPDVRTNSNEITYWLDRSYTEFGDDFMIFGFYVNKKVIGFAQLAFLRCQRILFFDYIVLHKEYRRHGEYFQFVRMLHEWIDSERFEFDYAVAEVSYESSGPIPSENSMALVTLFKQMGLGVAQCEYYQPLLGTNNPQSNMRAHLLISSRERLKRLKRETVLYIVQTVYFQHYERWYTPFIPKIDNYKKFLQKRFRGLEKHLERHKDVVINGAKRPIDIIYSLPPDFISIRYQLRDPLIVVVAFGVFCAAFFYVQSRTQLGWQVIAILFAGALFVFATAFALFRKDQYKVLDSLLSGVVKLFGKQK